MEKLKILVFDDKEVNREAAKIQLKDHDLTIVGSYDNAEKLLEVRRDNGILNKPYYDVVLTDLLVPPSEKRLARPFEFSDQIISVGVFIGILAAKNGVKNVAVFTDSNHHQHPASACFDSFNGSESFPTPFLINGNKILFSNNRNWMDYFRNYDFNNPLSLKEAAEIEMRGGPTVKAKNWARVLKYLLETPIGFEQKSSF